MLEFYRELIRLRRTLPGLADRSRGHMQVHSFEEEEILQIRRWSEGGDAICLPTSAMKFAASSFDVPVGEWHRYWTRPTRTGEGRAVCFPTGFQSCGKARLSLRPKSFALFERAP